MRQKTETMLCAAFMELLKKCPFSKITIQKLAGQCGVNRQTFYYHFDNIYDLMSKAFEYELVHESHIYEEVTWEYAMSRFLQWIKDNRVIIRNILTNAELPYLKKAMWVKMISSTSNIKVKNIINLKKSAKARKKENCFLVEGPRMFFEIPRDRVMECYLTEEFAGKYDKELRGWNYELISENVCRHLSDTKTPQGVIAVVRREEPDIGELINKEKNPCFFLLESLQDPGNLGTIVRTAEGAGVTGIIMNKETVDIYNPKVIRSTMGAIFRVPFVITDDLPQVVEQLKQKGISVYAGHLKGDVFYKQDYRNGSAFLIGNEGNGLTDEITALADHKIKIPMKGKVESLNAAVSATILMYETMRQREFISDVQ